MTRKTVFSVLVTLMTLLPAQQLGAKDYKLSSPDGKIRFTLSDKGGALSYEVSYDGKQIVETSAMGFEFAGGERFGEKSVSLERLSKSSAVEEYDLPVGKKSHVCDAYNQLYAVAKDSRTGKKVEIYVRAFDDAVAFRYVIPSQTGWDKLVIANELTALRPSGDPLASTLMFDRYINSHEGLYTRARVSEQTEGRLVDMPMLLEFPGCFVSVTESNIVDYAGMYLVRKGDCFHARLSPKLTDESISVEADLPHRTPWRVMLIGDKPGKLIESTVITSLADPCKVEDLSWLKPGKTTFPWWCDSVAPDTTFQWGNNFQTAKYYIDFAAESGLDYHSVYGYADMPWYYDDGPGFGAAGPNADLTRPDSRLDFAGVCRYARSKGVDIHVWLNWAALYKDIDRVFDKFNEWGVKGMMVDFMDRNDQEMIRIQEEILSKAASHKLFIQFHGASKPSGLVRTYPNEFTREGTLNYEVYKWDSRKALGADHDIMMPFTRLTAGAADYHLGGFRSLPRDKFEARFTAPYVISTRCHMLAMYIVLESYLSMVCDYPDAYRGQEGFDFLCGIPTNWDDTVVPASSVGEYCCIARRHGDQWWMGCINNSSKRSIDISLDFLEEGRTWTVDACTDAPDCDDNPNHLQRCTYQLKSGETLHLEMEGSGGFALKFTPTKPKELVIGDTRFVSRVTGASLEGETLPNPNETDRNWNLGGTDLGIIWETAPGKYALVFGDSYGRDFRPTSGGPGSAGEWRSNVVGFSEDSNLEDGLAFSSMMTTPDKPGYAAPFQQRHFDREFTYIPNGAIELNGKQYIHHMYWEVFWRDRVDEFYSTYSVSEDGGQSWKKCDDQIIFHYPSNFGIAALAKRDGDPYAYIIGSQTGYGYRRTGPHLGRFLYDDILDETKYEFWDGNSGKWVKGDETSATELFPSGFGEASVVWMEKYQLWLTFYINNRRGGIFYRTAREITGPWSEERPLIWRNTLDIRGGYGSFIHPISASSDSGEIFWTMSQWYPYNVFLMKSTIQQCIEE